MKRTKYTANIDERTMIIKIREVFHYGNTYSINKPYEFRIPVGMKNYDGSGRELLAENLKLRIGYQFDDISEFIKYVSKKIHDLYELYDSRPKIRAYNDFISREDEMDGNYFLRNVSKI